MAKEPENLVLELLGGMRADFTAMKQDMKDMRSELRSVHKIVDGHTMRFDFLGERVARLGMEAA